MSHKRQYLISKYVVQTFQNTSNVITSNAITTREQSCEDKDSNFMSSWKKANDRYSEYATENLHKNLRKIKFISEFYELLENVKVCQLYFVIQFNSN